MATTEFHGTIYNAGDIIPGYVTETIYPKVYYDSSKKYIDNNDIFDELSIDPKVWMGDEPADMSSNDEIVNDIMQYLNLHIIQIGYDFYIFDWYTVLGRYNNDWYEIYDKTTMPDPIRHLVNVGVNDYKSADTNITMGEVYNQLKATCSIDKFDTVIKSPFDDSDLYSKYKRPQMYMREHVVEGVVRYPANEFARIMLNKNYVPNSEWAKSINDSYFVEWWMQVMQNDKWSFKLNGNNVYSTTVYEDQNGVYYDQCKLLEYIQQTPFASGLIKWGHGEHRNWKNWLNIENITSFDTYLVIGVNGNGLNNHGNYKFNYSGGQVTPGSGIHIEDGVPFPDVTDLQNANMSIEYYDSTEVDYSPTDDETINYLVLSGKFVLQPFIQKTGPQGQYQNPQTEYTIQQGNIFYKGFVNFDAYFKLREELNTWQSCYDALYNTSPVGAMDLNNDGWDQKGREYLYKKGRYVGSKDNDEGRYYQQLFYDIPYSGVNIDYEQYKAGDKNFLSPPVDYGDLFKLYKYDIGTKSYYKTQEISIVPIFECELKIGDKYCVETFDENGQSVYQWLTSDELPNYTDDTTGQTLKKSTFSLGFIPQGDDWIIGQEHEFKNTVNTSMGISSKGTSIPIRKSDELSGDVTFKIIGLINTYWDNGIRRHPTWFRRETLTENAVPILSHVRSILIKNFDVEFDSDNGGYSVTDDKDLVYVSAETDKFVNVKDDIEFNINTALTSEEAYQAGTTTTINKNNVIYYETGERILGITDTFTGETAKAEQHYIDQYYNEYSNPRITLETELNNENGLVYQFNKYHFNYFNDKQFYPIKIDYNLATNSARLTLREN